MTEKWIPLSGDPDVFNEFLTRIGAKSNYTFHDLWSFEQGDLSFFPQPVLAVILLFPTFPDKESPKKLVQPQTSFNVEFFKQAISNSCGTVALIHALINNKHVISSETGSVLSKIIDDFSKTQDPNERGLAIASNTRLSEIHKFCSKSDISRPEQEVNLDVNTHFSCFVMDGENLIELDGRKPAPVMHFKCKDLLEGTVGVARARIESYRKDTEGEQVHQFSAMILAPSQT